MSTSTTPTTLRDQWQAHMDRTLPIDAPERQVQLLKRQWYAARLEELLTAPKTAENAALLAEAIGFGRAIGRAEETAT